MSKKKIYYSEAERLYVEEQMTIEEIASRFNVSVRTLKSWKKDNDWTIKRKEFLDAKYTYHQDLYAYSHEMLSSINEDQAGGRKISTGRLYSFARMVDTFSKHQKYEEKIRKFLNIPRVRKQKITLSPEEIREI